MVNPFEAIEVRLSSIEQLLQQLLSVSKPGNEKPEDDLVSLKEAAKILQLSPDRFYSIHKKHFPVRKPGKYNFFSRKELVDYINGRQISHVDKHVSTSFRSNNNLAAV